MGADEVVITGNEQDIVKYAQAHLDAGKRVRNLRDLKKDLNASYGEETDLEEFKKMIVTIKDPSKRRKAMDDIKRFGKKSGSSYVIGKKKPFRIDKMRDGKSFRIDGGGEDLNKFALDMKNYYGAEIKAESYDEDIEIDEKFKSIEPKVIDRIEKMMNGSRQEKDQIQNMLNYLMPREVVDMVRYKLKIKEPMGKIKIR
jgi:hypothetical protein